MSGHGTQADPNDPFQKRVAISMAVYTVALAFTNALTSNANSKAIIKANEAAARWSYFQSKSIKQSVKQLEISLVVKLAPAGTTPNLDKEKAEIARYDGEKVAIEREARELESAQKVSEHQTHTLEYGAIAFELGIIFAGVSLLQRSKVLFYLSIVSVVAGVGTVIFAVVGAH